MIHVNDPAHAEILAANIGVPFFPGRDHCIARVVHGELVGGVIFNDYTGASIGMHVYGFNKRWINRDMLWVAFDYPFEQLGVDLILGKIEETNKSALDFNRKLGFSVAATIPGVYPSGALVLMSMRRSECRQLHIKPRMLAHGKEERRPAPA